MKKKRTAKKRKIAKKNKSGIKLTSKKTESFFAKDILWRPDRLPYITDALKGKECVFCRASKLGPCFESLVLWQSETYIILMNKFPYNNGHLLVVPRRHLADISDLNSEEYMEVHSGIKVAIDALRKGARKLPDGFNVGLNLGSAAGAGLPGHLHYHVIPRWVGDSNFFPIIAQTKVISETLEQAYQRLLPCFSN